MKKSLIYIVIALLFAGFAAYKIVDNKKQQTAKVQEIQIIPQTVHFCQKQKPIFLLKFLGK